MVTNNCPTCGVALHDHGMACRDLSSTAGHTSTPIFREVIASCRLVATPSTEKNFVIGIAGGQSVSGGTVTNQNLTLRLNAADTTTGCTTSNFDARAEIHKRYPSYRCAAGKQREHMPACDDETYGLLRAYNFGLQRAEEIARSHALQYHPNARAEKGACLAVAKAVASSRVS
jgi:hypothetical protein